jgi:2-polyprenyl-6-methoxyphenol hydroxylase-like FAD-dependent oxidoreductase
VGDAGYTKDPVTAQGITDAFHTADQCAAPLDTSLRNQRPFGEAMAEYQQARDQHMVPIYEFTTQLATVEPPSPEMQQLFAGMQGDQAAMDAFVSVTAGSLSPGEFFASVSSPGLRIRAGFALRPAPAAVSAFDGGHRRCSQRRGR